MYHQPAGLVGLTPWLAPSMRFGIFGDSMPSSSGGSAASQALSSTYLPLADPSVASTFITLSFEIVRETRGPMRLWEFAARLRIRLGAPPMHFIEWCDAVKATLTRIDHPRLRLLAPGMPGVGYVFDAADPDSVPLRSGR